MKPFQRLPTLVNNMVRSYLNTFGPPSMDAQPSSSTTQTTAEKLPSLKPLVSSYQTLTSERKQMDLPANSMLLIQQREPSVGGATLSVLTYNGDTICNVLEDVIREIPGAPVESWKIKGQTAIPEGVYELTLETSNRFGPNTLTVNRVRGFVGVRCHGGNHAVDTEGCLLFGMRSGEAAIVDSQKYLRIVKTLVCGPFSQGHRVFIDIRNP